MLLVSLGSTLVAVVGLLFVIGSDVSRYESWIAELTDQTDESGI